MAFLNEHLMRQRDIVPTSILGTKITIIGAGAIGGWTALSLAKMGFCDITVYDFDKVDTVNMSSQFFRFSDIGKPKVQALKELIKDFTGTEITAKEERYESGTFTGIVVSAVDSMAVRRTIWDNHKEKGFFTKAVIDPRMGAESATLAVIRPLVCKDRADYEKSLYSDDEAISEACTAKATIYCANMLSGLVVKSIKSLLTRPDYLRFAQWNVAEDCFLGFKAIVA